ncbi:zinc-ribbon domain-containing protein [Cuneatibacter caecimuris]|uniref:Zinc ribbon protein n=1 Tax=Cuneatibacter caecimuris TaxID=1796618 RepID=A0A4Q7PU89_9FIRM|nr:zinc-ribbon domain-containing protein [Cuneatibacter caecimuris]RZT02900.1 zinc ribbon protein [Cuneatibacter caecimuris]
MALFKCPECGKEISDRASTCPNCGCPIETEEKRTKIEIEEKAEQNLVPCTKCGCWNEAGTTYCEKCGNIYTYREYQKLDEMLGRNTNSNKVKDKTDSLRTLKLVTGIIGIVASLGLAWIVGVAYFIAGEGVARELVGTALMFAASLICLVNFNNKNHSAYQLAGIMYVVSMFLGIIFSTVFVVLDIVILVKMAKNKSV